MSSGTASLRMVVCSGLAGLAPLAAQQFLEVGKHALPWAETRMTAVATGDVDGDGDLDVVFGQRDGPVLLLTNDGTGVYSVRVPRLVQPAQLTRALLLVDVDADRDLDLVVGNLGQSRLLVNDGRGGFREAAGHLPGAHLQAYDVAAADLDRDGDLDLVLATFQQNRIYANDGTGRFVDVSAARAPAQLDPTRSVSLGDVDRDGDVDILFGNTARIPCTLWLNDGAGTFRDASATHLPGDLDYTTDTALGDLDGDGDLDLVTATETQIDRVYRNDGTGRFVGAPALPSGQGRSEACVLADADGDGDLDVALGSDYDQYYGRRHILFLNRGDGTFTPALMASSLRDPAAVWGLAFADVDGDADLDLFLAAGSESFGEQPRLYVNDGAGGFRDASERGFPPDQQRVSALAVADFDGDGARDILCANGYSPGYSDVNLLWANDGQGRFSDTNPFAGQFPAFTHVLQVGDIDGDGDLDVFFGNMPGNDSQDRLFRNDGRGRFADITATHLPLDDDHCYAALFADLDGDGDLDLVVSAHDTTSPIVRLFRNDGTGRLRRVLTVPAAPDLIGALAAGDVDGDGDADLLLTRIGTRLQGHLLFRNDGGLVFRDATAAHLPAEGAPAYAVRLLDVDSDRDLDAVFATTWQNALYLNDGRGVFVDVTATHLPGADGADALAVGDVDGDGDIDLVFSGKGNAFLATQARLYRNDGRGRFTDATLDLPQEALATNAIALADLDDDGDLDVVLAGRWRNSVTVYRNHLRQLSTPHLPTLGRAHRLDFTARGGSASPQAVIPLFAAGEARIALPPFGTLRLDPTTLVNLSAMPMPSPGATVSLGLPVPIDPALHGRVLFAQALFVGSSDSAALSNLVAEMISR